MQVNFGVFLASMTSSFVFRERTIAESLAEIKAFVPGEIIRGHLFYDPRIAEALKARGVIHYFIYRDPRDVAVSEAHYLQRMNPWHRLHRHFKNLSDEQAIDLAIRGLDGKFPSLNYPDIARRFQRYAGWLRDPNTLAIQFEDLRSERQVESIRAMIAFYHEQSPQIEGLEEITSGCVAAIKPCKSHTFRNGRQGGWRTAMSPANIATFKEVAGELLIELGYERDSRWV
jgi:hypothetical protein